jgi:hypothetical protein
MKLFLEWLKNNLVDGGPALDSVTFNMDGSVRINCDIFSGYIGDMADEFVKDGRSVEIYYGGTKLVRQVIVERPDCMKFAI